MWHAHRRWHSMQVAMTHLTHPCICPDWSPCAEPLVMIVSAVSLPAAGLASLSWHPRLQLSQANLGLLGLLAVLDKLKYMCANTLLGFVGLVTHGHWQCNHQMVSIKPSFHRYHVAELISSTLQFVDLQDSCHGKKNNHSMILLGTFWSGNFLSLFPSLSLMNLYLPWASG